MSREKIVYDTYLFNESLDANPDVARVRHHWTTMFKNWRRDLPQSRYGRWAFLKRFRRAACAILTMSGRHPSLQYMWVVLFPDMRRRESSKFMQEALLRRVLH